MTSSVDGGLSIGRILQADGAPRDDFRGLPEDDFRFTLAHTEASLKPSRNATLGDRQRILSDQLRGPFRLMEDLIRAEAHKYQLKKTLPQYYHSTTI